MPWLRSGETFDTAAGSLAAKILCNRHNAALSPLDEEAALFFSILTKALSDLSRKTLSRKPIFHLVSGDALELWMLKVACGIYFSVASKGGVRLAERYTIDLEKVRRAFYDSRWDAKAGLYLRGAKGTPITIDSNVGFAPLIMDHTMHFGGAAVSLRGFKLELVFDTTHTNVGAWSGIIRKPSELVLKNAQREHHIILTWPPGTPEASVTIARTRLLVADKRLPKP